CDYTPFSRFSFFFLQCFLPHPDLHSFPTRRSSDLVQATVLSSSDIHAHNTFEHPRALEPSSEKLAAGGSPMTYRFAPASVTRLRSEEHTSELQSRGHLVCRLLLEKKKKIKTLNIKT